MQSDNLAIWEVLENCPSHLSRWLSINCRLTTLATENADGSISTSLLIQHLKDNVEDYQFLSDSVAEIGLALLQLKSGEKIERILVLPTNKSLKPLSWTTKLSKLYRFFLSEKLADLQLRASDHHWLEGVNVSCARDIRH
ncbi:hypothetical protein H6G00_01420 [Leptolyngbya sp. FACHB-541]|uniref:hypothetical protein n=1 Tax=Leptolyngbya sp. FACHB-541 TaxID=2692810 RepID=UPI001685B70B|nr:hypothetical protein [Leptolyngbya sp. FACHB-541]MBD1995289.1 hypothetical protein [Leptolyngbya sp. FACHB-541]